jgi:hypothetical protein
MIDAAFIRTNLFRTSAKTTPIELERAKFWNAFYPMSILCLNGLALAGLASSAQRRRLWNIVEYISYFVEFRETIGSIHTYDNDCRGALATTC